MRTNPHILYLVFFICFALSIGLAKAQTIPQKSAVERLNVDNVASKLPRYGGGDELQASAGGDIGLSIPVAVVQGRKLRLPVTLHYEPGIQVDQAASDVGLGWSIDFGRIRRDAGAFEPDYAEVGRNEVGSGTEKLGGGTLLSSQGSGIQFDVSLTEALSLKYDGLDNNQTMPDDYHVSLPGKGGGTFWNNGVNESAWKWTEHQNWVVQAQPHTFEFDQEFSRVNEVNFPTTENMSQFNAGLGSYAAAIAIPEYVTDHFSTKTVLTEDGNGIRVQDALAGSAKYIQYRDYKGFTIVDEEGTQYVFGKPLRAQKFIFSEDPYWSSMTQRQRDLAGPPTIQYSPETSLGEGWKQEYIAEWCLTEVRSHDYVDANFDGVANDGDLGDWIRIEYDREYWKASGEDQTQLETVQIPGVTAGPIGNRYPYYREYTAFSQTDIASATWRELAYVKRIVTPVQELKVAFSPRMEVDFDYYEKISNRIYQEEYRNTLGMGSWAGFENMLKISYPNRLQKYTSFELHDRILGEGVVNGAPGSTRKISRAELQYAAKGAADELCVSNFLIRDNNNVEGTFTSPASPVRTTGRGKTTLKAILMTGDFDSPSPNEVHRYSFEYGYNPDYTPIHRAKMWGELYFPNRRVSFGRGNWKLAGEHLYNMNYFPVLEPFQMATNANHYAHELQLGATISWPYYTDFIPPTGPYFSGGMEKMVNEMGYFYTDAGNGAAAWSLTQITYPTGGSTELSYAPDQIDLSSDSTWGIRPNQLTNVQLPFNTYVTQKGIQQTAVNADICMSKPKTTSSPFFFPLTSEGGGVRIAAIAASDGLGTTYTRTFEYGPGKLVRMNAAYWNQFAAAFGKHVRIQKAKQLIDHYCGTIPGMPNNYFDGDFDLYDQYYTAQFRVDKNLEHDVTYQWVKETFADGSAIRKTYQVSPFNLTGDHVRIMRNLNDLRRDLHVIFANPLLGWGLLQKVEYIKAGTAQPYASEAYSYLYQVLATKGLSFLPNNSNPMSENYTIQTYKTVDQGFPWCFQNPPCVDPGYFSPSMAITSSNSPYTLFPNALAVSRSHSQASTLHTKATRYEGLETVEEYNYTPTTFQLRATKVANSATLTGPADVRVSQTRYAWEQYTGPEKAKILEKNLIAWPFSSQQYGTSSMLPNAWSDNELLAATCQTIDYVPLPGYSSYQLYPGKSYRFTTDNLNAQTGWLQGFAAFQAPAFVSGTAPSNPAAWVEADAVPMRRDAHGNVTHYDTPYLAGRIVYGYNRSTVQAHFENTGGLDASYIGFEDAAPSDLSLQPTQFVLGDDWQLSSNPGQYSSAKAHTGRVSYLLPAGAESHRRAFSISPATHFPGHTATLNNAGKYAYKVSWWIYASAAGSYQLKVQPNSGTLQTFNQTIPAADIGRWVYREQAIEIAPATGGFTPFLQNGAGQAALYLDDMLVYPEGTEYQYEAFDHRRASTWWTGTQDASLRTDYDHMGRVKAEYDAAGTRLSSYRYHLATNLTTENSYIEVARHIDAARVGISRVYLDGLGRAKQTIVWEPSQARGIIAQTTDYDIKGRAYRQWSPLPLPNLVAGLPAKVVPNYAQRATQFYGSSYAYTRTDYDLTPDNRPLRVYQPRMNGAANHFVTFEYRACTTATAGYAANQLMEVVKTDEAGHRFYSYHDKLGQKVQERQPLGAGYQELPLGGVGFSAGAGQMATTAWRYDQAGRPTAITNPLGQVTTLSYNSRGDLLQETHPDRGTTQFRYDRWGRLRLRRDANDAANASHPDPQVACSGGNCLRFQYLKYDRLGRPTEEGTLYTTVAGHFSDPAFRDDPAFPGAGLAYQAHILHSYGTAAGLGRGLPATVSVHQAHSFTPAGAVFSPTATDLTTYTYDVNGRVVQQVRTLHGLAGMHTMSSTYNRQGLATETRYRSTFHQKDYWRRTVYDDLGRPVAHYSGHDDLALQQSQSQLDSRFAYDAVGRLYRRHIAATGNSAQPYLVQEELHHDIRSRVTAQRSDRLDIALTYDPRGNIQSQRWQNRHFDADTTRWNQYTYQYDPDYRLVAADYGQLRMVCGAASPARQAGLPDEPFVRDGQATYLGAQDQPEPPFDEKAVLDRNSQQDALAYEEDPALLEDLVARLGEAALEGFAPVYRLDGTDHLASIIAADGTWRSAAEIDLSAAVGEHCYAVLEPSDRYDTWYRYDAAGNLTRLQRRQTHPTTGAWALSTLDYSYAPGMPSNRLDKVGGAGALYSSKYTYDANGNMVSDQATGLTAVRHDWRNRPLEMTDAGAVHRYRYDAAGQRSYRELQVGTTITRREYHLDGLVLDANGSLLRMELAEGYAELLPGGGLARRYVLRDWLGSPRVTLDPAGTVLQARDTDPYGRPLDQRNYALGQEAGREGFTGHERDAETGYDYHGARYYQAEIGRYLGVDVMAGEMPGWNGYHYAAGSPTMIIDATGMDTTYVFNTQGRFLTKINDNLENQVHYIEQDRFDEILQLNDCAMCTSNELAEQVRSNSTAYLGKSQALAMESLYSKTTKLTREEIGGFTFVSPQKELIFWHCKECQNPENPNGMAIDLYSFDKEKFRRDLDWFASWHSHPILVTQSYHFPSGYDGDIGAGSTASRYEKYGIGKISGGPGLILTDMGFTFYRHSSSTYSPHTTTDGMRDPQNHHSGYSWVHIPFLFFK